jgi:hypothetical protein
VDDALRVAVEWLVNSLAAGTSEEEVASHLAPRMRRQGDMVLALSRAPRFAVFREHRPVIERIDVSGQWMALAQVSAGSQRWELEVVLQPEPPHLIRLPSPRQARQPAAPQALPDTARQRRIHPAQHAHLDHVAKYSAHPLANP